MSSRSDTPDDSALPELLLEGIAGVIDPRELERRGQEGLREIAADAVSLASKLAPGEVAVRVQQGSGARRGRAIVEILAQDQPFLVDTFRLTLDRLGLQPRLLAHPLLAIRRREDGAIDGLGPHADAAREAWVYAEVTGADSLEQRIRVQGEIARSMRSVQEVVEDHAAMLEALDRHMAEIGTLAPLLDEGAERVRQMSGFLRWLADGHFIFLGYRHYEVSGDGDPWQVRLDAGSGLGLMRSDSSRSRFDGWVEGERVPSLVRGRLADDRVIFFDKSRSESTIHRHGRIDSVSVKRLDAQGRTIGFGRFIGLLTNQAHRQRPSATPILERRCEQVAAALETHPGSHLHKAVVAGFDALPIEFLFQFDLDDVVAAVSSVVTASENRQVETCVVPDPRQDSFFMLVSVPRRAYDEALRDSLREMLEQSYGASHIDGRTTPLDDDLVVMHFFCSGADTRLDALGGLERDVRELASRWEEALEAALVERHGERDAWSLAHVYAPALPEAYRVSVGPEQAAHDVEALEQLREGEQRSVLRLETDGARGLELKVYRRDRPYLTDLAPVLDHFGLRVIDASATHVDGPEHLDLWILVFGLEPLPADAPERPTLEQRLLAGIRAALDGRVEEDVYGRLVLEAGLTWREVDLLRALLAYREQLGQAPTRAFAAEVLMRHAPATRALVNLFAARFNPDLPASDPARDRPALEARAARQLEEARAVIPSSAEDRIFALLESLTRACVRTSFYRHVDPEAVHELAFKIDPAGIPGAPEPRPYREIFVHSAEMAGVHLRGGPVARGGIRWSDRPLDFRTEILGLMKAQMTKNGVIVPVGSKGGFVLRRAPTDPAALRAEADRQYARFIGNLLALTDNQRDDRVIEPERVVRYDDDDPYLVVAADKGTAHLPDVANAQAAHAGFWLGDAFASGGSNGYDHKAEGITAAGAWVSVRRHFLELGLDVDRETYTVVGIGDMSGDVFGNGLLLARKGKLLAAFNHLHVFIDPDPDPESSWKERVRLFELERSTWADYAPGLISEGGGVFERSARRVELSAQMREMLRVEDEEMSGEQLIRAVLSMPVDLLWNGGIGTYVKASSESHVDVGDKASEAVRIDARDLKARVVGEGGNLGLTQLARVEYALAGGRINTDALDNSGGVDLSDHEVNYKLLLARPLADGVIDEPGRSSVLRDCVKPADALVLGNNESQGRCVSIDQIRSWQDPERMALAVDYLERRGGLVPELEFLPDRETVRQRASQSGTRRGFARPEVCVLLGYTKQLVKRELIASDVPDQAVYAPLYADYFPAQLRERFADAAARHPLRREITATCIANRVIDLAGVTLVPELSQALGFGPAEVVAAYHLADLICDAQELRDELESLEVAETLRLRSRLRIEDGVRVMAGVLLGLEACASFTPEQLRDRRKSLRELRGLVPGCLSATEIAQVQHHAAKLVERGLPEVLALRIEQIPVLARCQGALAVAAETGRPLAEITGLHARVGEAARISFLLARLEETDRSDPWRRVAAESLHVEMLQAQRDLTRRACAAGDVVVDPARIRQLDAIVDQIQAEDPDMAALLVLSQQIRRLC